MAEKTKNEVLAEETRISMATYLRLLYVNRILIGVAITTTFLMLLTVGVAVSLLPLKTVETRYVEFQTGGNNFVSIADANSDLSANDALISMLLRKYVVDRETINQIDEKERYQAVYAMSTEETATEFKKFYGGDNALIYKEGFRRKIVLGPTTRLAKNIVVIDFQTTDTNVQKPEQAPVTKEWQATIKYGFAAQQVKEDQKELNPIGIFVMNYQPSPRRY
jgi:type IV secretory pathway component VirB8